MKKTVLLLCLCFAGFGSFSQKPLFADQPKDSVVHFDPRMQQGDFVPGEILVKYKDEVQVQNLKAGNIVQTGLATIDSIFSRYRISDQQKLFPAEQKLKSKVMLRSFNGKEFEKPSLHNIYKLTLPQESDMFRAIEELKQDPDVIYAEPNYILSVTNDRAVSPPLTEKDLEQLAAGKLPGISNTSPIPLPGAQYPVPLPVNPPDPKSIPNDPLFPQQWYIPAVHADAVWDSVQGKDTTQVICILDTGVDWMHPDLQNKIWSNPGEIPGNGIDDDGNGYVDDIRGWDWINNDNNPMDDNSHGTHVAGIAAAEANNGIGISGVSHGAKIIPLKVFQSSGRGDAATIATGINYAKNKGATVINMSFGSYALSLTMEQALANAYATTILVAAAGNDGRDIGDCPPGGPFYPAALSYVLGVMAPDGGFSNSDCTGPTFSLSPQLNNYEMKAPGTNIISTIPNGNYRVYQGTSMAAPVVSGSLAMYRPLRPEESMELMWVKLIQSTSEFLNIEEALNKIPATEVRLISQTMVDTLAGDDNDGRVDAGETIQFWFTARNTGGQCDSTWFMIRLHEFEDTTTAHILKPLSFIGSMSPYATRTSQFDPMKLHISPNVAHDRDIVFDLLFWFKGCADTTIQQVVLTVENGEQLSGVLDTLKVLYPNRLYLVNNSFKVGTEGTLIIKPGTKILFYPGKTVPINGILITEGKPDSLITFMGYEPPNSMGVIGTIFDFRNNHNNIRNRFNYCRFENIGEFMLNGGGNTSVFNSIINVGAIGIVDSLLNNNCHFPGQGYGNTGIVYGMGLAYKNNFIGPGTTKDYYYNGGFQHVSFGGNFQYNNIFNYQIPESEWADSTKRNSWISEYSKPRLFWNGAFYFESEEIYYKYYTSYQSAADFQKVQYQYWGTNDSTKIEGFILDFMENPTWPKAIFRPNLSSPPDSCHGIVWKILVNCKDAQDEYVDPVGVGPQRFDVYFNREMDTTYTPQLSFGVRYPYTQQSVADSVRWDATHRIWTAWKKIGLYTGDGINRLRVSGARDLEGWEIPVEDMRFQFLISAAGSASTNFMARAGIGKVYLEWNNAGIEDLLGFNIYRFENITDTTYTAPVIINSSLVTDTTFTDFAVTPGQRYWYYYKVVNTDFREADSSKFVNAVPYNASVGDANGDESVNVLDIMAVIAYMLGQDPQPFLFDAADVNDDNAINILDVIGIVNRIIHPEKSGFDITGTNPASARIRLESDRIILQSDGQIASMQFELTGEGLDKIRLAEPPAGFELAYGIVKGKLLGILYSSSRKVIPAGTIDLVKIVGKSAVPEWGTILAGDGNGNIVPVLKETPAGNAKPEMFLQAYPNPFSQKVTFSFRLTSDAHVKISVYNMAGKLVTVLADKEMKEGMNYIDWNGTNFNRRTVTSGIYLCRLEGTARDGSAFHRETRIVYIN